ncbi:glycosyltransferase family 4 protein [Ovoidimarina sediminis]|uniref:glycosyltransferase family 4 protein n=1 Tax=Ovoidimarina sediminis TaxID=3079856 RepID=UPI00290CE9D6|nr:glycosyltransferase family 4 protein [Rhodophyticola sp. MJ-SS7]MDU8945951.1 glycosyltransferase family 4 protein [Rhodophyticola sp. MJ-SS7]
MDEEFAAYLIHVTSNTGVKRHIDQNHNNRRYLRRDGQDAMPAENGKNSKYREDKAGPSQIGQVSAEECESIRRSEHTILEPIASSAIGRRPNQTILMLTLFPQRGNGSASLIADLVPELEGQGYRTANIFIDTEEPKTSSAMHGTLIREDILVFQSHPKSSSGVRFVDCDRHTLESLVDELAELTKKVVVSNGVSLLHVHHGWIGVIVAKRILDEFGIPFIVHFHGTEIETLAQFASAKDWKTEIISKIGDGLRASTKVLCASEEQKTEVNQILELVGARKRAEILYGGVNLSNFFHQVRANTGARTVKSCLFVGRLTPEKGVLDLLEAFTLVQETRNAHLIICGDGALRSEVEYFADQMGAAVSFRGFVADRAKLAALYNEASVVCMPSINEAFGLVAVEALACGAPVVAYSVGALPGIFEKFPKGLAGELIEKHDVIAMSDALKRILDNERNEKERIVRSTICARLYSIRQAARDLCQIYSRDCQITPYLS